MADYIDRKTALSFPFANEQYDHENANENFIFGCETYKEWLENLPVANMQEVKHGKWLFVIGNCREEIWMCNQCERCIRAERMEKDELIKRYPYCHCGAIMDEKGE